MRNREIVKIDEEEFSIKELTVKEIIDLYNGILEEDLSAENFKTQIPEVLKLVCPELTLERLQSFTPSAIMKLWQGFTTANSSFFDIARTFGIQQLAEEVRANVVEILRGEFSKRVAD